jgi:hypothetical protein
MDLAYPGQSLEAKPFLIKHAPLQDNRETSLGSMLTISTMASKTTSTPLARVQAQHDLM